VSNRAAVEGAQVVVDPGVGPPDLAEHGDGGGAVSNLRDGVDRPVDGDVVVKGGCGRFGRVLEKQPGVQFVV
jgi:hypothetical protein